MSDAGEKPRYGDFRDFISRDELVDAMAIVSGDRAAAEAAANEAYSDIRSCFGMAGDLVSQLCLISDEKARDLLRISSSPSAATSSVFGLASSPVGVGSSAFGVNSAASGANSSRH
jgi:hypothetical protein